MCLVPATNEIDTHIPPASPAREPGAVGGVCNIQRDQDKGPNGGGKRAATALGVPGCASIPSVLLRGLIPLPRLISSPLHIRERGISKDCRKVSECTAVTASCFDSRGHQGRCLRKRSHFLHQCIMPARNPKSVTWYSGREPERRRRRTKTTAVSWFPKGKPTLGIYLSRCCLSLVPDYHLSILAWVDEVCCSLSISMLGSCRHAHLSCVLCDTRFSSGRQG